RPKRSRTVAAGSALGSVGWEERCGGTASRQEHAEPVGAAPDWFPCRGTLQQDQLFRRSARRTAGRSLFGSAPARTARDRAGPGRHRHAATRTARGTVFPRLLRTLLLSAAVCVLRRSSAVCAAAALEH